MTKETTFIRNPLTIIAVFAGIAEVSGTIVLPFVAPANQLTYIWFLMLFPFLLVFLFFGMLWFKHEVLYSPSDFKDEENFLRVRMRQSTITEILQKRSDNIIIDTTVNTSFSGAERNMFESGEPMSDRSTEALVTENNLLDSEYSLVEALVIRKLVSTLNLPLQRNVTIQGDTEHQKHVFAAAYSGSRDVIIEVLISHDSMSSKFVASKTSAFGSELRQLLPDRTFAQVIMVFAARNFDQNVANNHSQRIFDYVDLDVVFMHTDALKMEFGATVGEH